MHFFFFLNFSKQKGKRRYTKFWSLCSLYWKIKYVSRLQYLWDDIKKDQIEIPDFVQSHDDVLEHRPLTDYGIEPDPLHLTEVPAMAYSMGRYEERWASQSYSWLIGIAYILTSKYCVYELYLLMGNSACELNIHYAITTLLNLMKVICILVGSTVCTQIIF